MALHNTRSLLDFLQALTARLASLDDIEWELKNAGALETVEGLRSLLAAKFPPNYEQLCRLALKVCDRFEPAYTPQDAFELRELARAGLKRMEDFYGE